MTERVWGGPKVQVYLDQSQEWRWRFVAANHKILADSGEGYENKFDLFNALEWVMGSTYRDFELVDDGEQSYMIGLIVRNGEPLRVESPVL